MVNLKKISAVATGALFIGSTIGMAAAVDVPSGFSSSMLASGGQAKAQLVVGAAAPGKTADEASAQVIIDAVKAKLGGMTGGDISVTYGSDDIDDDGTTDNTDYFTVGGAASDEFSTSVQEGNLINVNGTTMNVDGNGDGKLDDTSDYALYSGLYVIDKETVQPYLAPAAEDDSVNDAAVFTSAMEDSNGNGYLGLVVKLKGSKYLVIKETDNETATIAPLLKASPSDASKAANPADLAVSLSGNLKVAYYKDSTYNGTLYFYDGSDLLDSTPVGGLAANSLDKDGNPSYVGQVAKTALPDEFSGLKIFYEIVGGNIKVKAGEKSQGIEVFNGLTGAMGYNTVYYYAGPGNNPEFSVIQAGMYLFGDPVTLAKGDKVDIPDTLLELDLDISNSLDLLKKETVSVASGSKLKSSSSKYSDFLGQTVTITAGGGSAGSGPTLEIVDEAGASSTMNHVMIGGPVANTMVASLVESGVSTVDWYASEGDIEVISGHPSASKTSLIVAGKNREKTAAAAQALADAL